MPPGDLMLLEDAEDIAEWLVAMRRTVTPAKWINGAVDSLAGLAAVM